MASRSGRSQQTAGLRGRLVKERPAADVDLGGGAASFGSSIYTDIDEARAAAERLAEERG